MWCVWVLFLGSFSRTSGVLSDQLTKESVKILFQQEGLYLPVYMLKTRFCDFNELVLTYIFSCEDE